MHFPFSDILHMIIMSAEFLVGISVNGFLIIVNCNDLLKSRKLMLLQTLLLCTGLSRFGLQIMLMVQSFFFVLFPLVYEENIYSDKMLFVWMFFSSTGIWFATCLSIFYCLKISGFTQHYFLWLKFRISKLILWLLLGSLLTSLGMAAVCIEVNFPVTEYNDVLRNTTVMRSSAKVINSNKLFLVNLALILPLAIFVMCTSMLLTSLYKHTHRMQNGSHSFSSARKEAHVNALKTVITFFCFFVSYFSAFMANMTFKTPYQSQPFFLVKEIMAAYPAGHSVIIIMSNSKLQESFRKTVCLRKKQ